MPPETSASSSDDRSFPFDDTYATERYNRVGLALSIFAALCFFVALWALNGFFTARTVYHLGLSLQLSFFSWGAGWLTHVVISLIEQHLWKLRTAVAGAPGQVIVTVYVLIILVGVIDVLTSSLAFLGLFAIAGFSPTDPTSRFLSTVLAEVIAILPEPVIVWLAVALWRVIQDEEVPHG